MARHDAPKALTVVTALPVGSTRIVPDGAGADVGDGRNRGDKIADDQWNRVRLRLRAEFGGAAYKSWLQPLRLGRVRDGQVVMTAPTPFMREWVMSRYSDRIRALWHGENPSIRSVDISVHDGPADGDPANGAAMDSGTLDAPDIDSGSRARATDSFVSTLDPRFTFDNFVVGRSNEFTYAAARRLAEAETVPFNPLFIYGGVGLGKTHLMHAIAWHIRKAHPERRVIYLSAEKFMYEFIRALRYQDMMAFKEQYRSVDVLMIDDVQFIGGKESTQEEFFHTFNALVDQSRLLVITGDRSPSDLDGMEERLRSRLGWGLVADIHSTDYELRVGILQSKLDQIGAQDVPQAVIEFLAHKITSNVRELEGALNRVVAHATLVGRPVTLETTRELLRDLLRANDRRVTIEEIQKRVSEHFNIRAADMHSARRARAVARPRQVAMYLAKQLTSRSLPEIGRKFGGRDHTTVMHAVRKVEQLSETDAGFAEDVELLRRMLEN